MQAVPTSVLLGFAYADYEEARKNFPKTSAIYERMLETKEIADATLVCAPIPSFTMPLSFLNDFLIKLEIAASRLTMATVGYVLTCVLAL